METVEFWVLDEDDRELVETLAAGLGRNAGRVLAYLLLRRERAAIENPKATRSTVCVGTDLSRKAVSEALSHLEERGLLTRTTVRKNAQGRPPKAWAVSGDRAATVGRVYDTHAEALLERATAVSNATWDRREAEPLSGTGVDVALNWLPNALHVPLYHADRCGAYERRDLEVGFAHYRGSHLALDALANGDADVAVVGAGTLVRARASDAPIVPIAVLYQRAATVLYTTRERFGEPLESVDQLEGCRIATAEGSETCLLARLFFSQTDLRDDIDIVDTEGEETEALLSGAADVATGSYADPLKLDDEGMTVDTVSIADHFPIYGATLVVRAASLAESTFPAKRFLAGTTEGWTEARHRPNVAVEAIAGETDEPPATTQRTFERAREEFGTSKAVKRRGWGWQRAETWNRIETALTQGELDRTSR